MLNWRDLGHPEAGGAELYLVRIAEGLAARGHDVTFRTAFYPGARTTQVQHGVRYVRKGGHYSIYPRALGSQFVGRMRGDVVIDVQNGVPFLTPLAHSGAPVINLVHHVHEEQWPVALPGKVATFGWQLESKVAPAVYRRSTYVAVSATTRDELVELGVDRERITVIPNGTEVLPSTATRADHPVITVLGRLVPHKRVEMALYATQTLRTRFPDLELRIVGSGYWEPELAQLAEELGISDAVTFTGHVSETEKYNHLAESWVLALPSLKEGWGLVVVEAGALRTPTVAFRAAGGTKDSIRDGVTGLLVEEGQHAFTRGLEQILSDPDLRERLGNEAKIWASGFRWEDSVLVWEDLIRRVVGQHYRDDARSPLESDG